jgi:hypothetical protein
MEILLIVLAAITVIAVGANGNGVEKPNLAIVLR